MLNFSVEAFAASYVLHCRRIAERFAGRLDGLSYTDTLERPSQAAEDLGQPGEPGPRQATQASAFSYGKPPKYRPGLINQVFVRLAFSRPKTRVASEEADF